MAQKKVALTTNSASVATRRGVHSRRVDAAILMTETARPAERKSPQMEPRAGRLTARQRSLLQAKPQRRNRQEREKADHVGDGGDEGARRDRRVELEPVQPKRDQDAAKRRRD